MKRSIRERLLTLSVGFFFGSGTTFVIFSRAVPTPLVNEGLVVGAVLVAGAVGAVATDFMMNASIHALRVARLGTPSEKEELLARSTGSGGDPAALALVAIEVRDLARAAELLERPIHQRSPTTLEDLARLCYELARGATSQRDKLVDEIVEWRSSSFGAHALELERYRALFVASFLVEDEPSDRTRRIAALLLASTDEQVRGYGAWLAREMPVEGKRIGDSFAMGAALAKHHGRDELATALDARASKLLAGAGPSPYRD